MQAVVVHALNPSSTQEVEADRSLEFEASIWSTEFQDNQRGNPISKKARMKRKGNPCC